MADLYDSVENTSDNDYSGKQIEGKTIALALNIDKSPSNVLQELPSTANKLAENEDYSVFINKEPGSSHDNEDPSGARKDTLWVHKKC